MLQDMFLSMKYLLLHHQLHKAAGGIIFMYQTTGLSRARAGPSGSRLSMLAQPFHQSRRSFNLLPIPDPGRWASAVLLYRMGAAAGVSA